MTRIIAIVLFIVSLGMAYYLYSSINSTIEFKKKIAITESQIKDKLEIIREAEKVFLEQNRRYTSNWDSLINFIENGQVPITVRTEKIIPLSYGEEKVEVKIDTIGMMPAKDKIFKKTLNINAADNGTFLGFDTKVGAYVVKRTPSYRIRINDKVVQYEFIDNGNISALADLKPGDQVTKGQNLITTWAYNLNEKVDIKTLGIVPGSEKPFDIYVGKIDRNGLKVNVIEVKDPAPINPERKATNEAKNRQPLGFGSRTDVSTSGNWE
ncbi:MAG: hypothetical protein JNM57_04040 [Cyclobacteriaceae bacterium]|nr:hypothetical protein [Cyclobacteriaceae bacterium]